MANNQFEMKKGIPAAISFWLPGFGQLYNKQYLKAMGFWVFLFLFNAIARDMWMLWILIAIWLFGIYDAYKNSRMT